NVITMERRADDGDWVGQSGDYDFRIERAAGVGAEEPSGAGTGEPEESRKSAPSPEGSNTDGSRAGEPPAEPEPRADQGTGVGALRPPSPRRAGAGRRCPFRPCVKRAAPVPGPC